MNERLQEFVSSLSSNVEKLLKVSKVDSFINGNKIKLVIGIDGVNAKVIPPLDKSKPKSKRQTSPQQVEQLKQAKKTFKDKLDVMNVVTLLIRLNDELNNIKVKDLDEDKLALLRNTMSTVNVKLQKLLT